MTARAWAGFATMSVLWGIPYLFIKIAIDGGLSPSFVAWSRVVLAAAVLLALSARAGVLGRGEGPRPLARRLRARGDHDPVPADRGRRAAHRLVADRDRDRLDAADRRAARAALRPRRACDRQPARRPAARLHRRRRARRDRRRRQLGRAPRRGLRAGGELRLRGRPDDPAPPARRPRPARRDGRLARDRGGVPDSGHRAVACRPRRRPRTRCSRSSCSACSAPPSPSSSSAA